MKKLTAFITILLLVGIMAATAKAVTVKFVVNTSTVPDTLGPNSVVQVRGGTAPLTWGGDSPVFLKNVGGDYWEGTAEFAAGEVQYKFYTNASHDTVYSGAEWEHQGWEGDLANPGNNRIVTVGTTDMVLPLQFVNGYQGGADQFFKPYTTNDSTFVVWVRVNVQGWEDFNPDAQTIGIRGSNNVDWGQTGEISWGQTYPLVQEKDHANGGSRQYSGKYFYSNAIHVPKQYAGKGIEFKVVVHNASSPLNEDWGLMIYNSNLQNKVSLSGSDTTNYWFWFDNKKPIPTEHKDVVSVTFTADLAAAISNNGFAFGDTLRARFGYYGTAKEVGVVTMARQGFSTLYAGSATITTTIGQRLDYQYYKVKNGVEYREIYYNFYYDGDITGEQERRVYSPIGGSTITIEDIVEGQSDVHRMPRFRNTDILARDVLVTFTCDIRPAIYQVLAGATLRDIQGNVNISSVDQIMQLGVAMNGPASGGWGTWGPNLMTLETKKMWDDGTHGDAVAGDSIYTLQIQYNKDSSDVVGQEFKFGIGGGDNEGGFGNNHIENIDDSQSTFTISAQFGSIDPVFYSAWDFDNRIPTDVDDFVNLPFEYNLDQNYPNPFNPTTYIRYSLAKPGQVSLSVYNILGEKIVTLLDKVQAAGTYQITWNGRDSFGRTVGSGIYFYKLESGNYTRTQKMMMLK